MAMEARGEEERPGAVGGGPRGQRAQGEVGALRVRVGGNRGRRGRRGRVGLEGAAHPAALAAARAGLLGLAAVLGLADWELGPRRRVVEVARQVGVEDLARGRGEVARLLEVARQRGPRRAGAGGAGAGRAAGGAAAGDAEGVLEVPLPVRAGNRRFGRLSSLRTYTKAPYNLLTCYGINAKGA